MIDQLPIGPRPAGKQGIQFFFRNLLQIAARSIDVLQNLVLHLFGTEHLMAVVVEAGDLGHIAENSTIGPLIALGDDRHHAHAEGFQFLEAVFVVDDVDFSKPNVGQKSIEATNRSIRERNGLAFSRTPSAPPRHDEQHRAIAFRCIPD